MPDTTATPTTEPMTPSSPVKPAARRGAPDWLHHIASRYALIVVWALMAFYFYLQVPDTFGTHGTFSSIFGSQQVLVFLAMSALITLVVGEFDLSVASIMGLTATTIPVLAGVHGVNIWLACVIGVGVAVLAGVVNAFFVVVMDVSSFVVTLGTGTLLAGIAQFVSGTNIVSVNNPGLADFAIKDADLLLLRNRAGPGAGLPAGLDADRAQHGLRRRQP